MYKEKLKKEDISLKQVIRFLIMNPNGLNEFNEEVGLELDLFEKLELKEDLLKYIK